jgi:hypothetical protein
VTDVGTSGCKGLDEVEAAPQSAEARASEQQPPPSFSPARSSKRVFRLERSEGRVASWGEHNFWMEVVGRGYAYASE